MCLEAATTFLCRHTFVKATICARDGNCRVRYTSDHELRFCDRCRMRMPPPKLKVLETRDVSGGVFWGGMEEEEEEEEKEEEEEEGLGYGEGL